MTSTYLINLARSTDRKSHMVRQFAKIGLPYEPIEAIDGRNLDLSQPEFAYAKVNSGLFNYSFGCALSHFKAYRKVLEDGVDVALILEDDLLFPVDFNELVEVAKQRMTGAEVVLLHFQSQEALLTMEGAEQLPTGHKLVQVVDKGTPRSTGAYLITRQACERMLKIMQPPVRCVADDWAVFYHEGAVDCVRCVVPMPVLTSPDIPTTRDNFRPGSVAASLLDAVNRTRVPIIYQLLRHRRKRFLNELHGRLDFASTGSAPDLPLMKRDI
jgi:glycosyl transferase family 25